MKNMMRMMMVWVVALTAAAQGVDNPIEGGASQTVTNDWQVQGVPWLFVGANTAGNSLIVTNGGTVGNDIGYIGGAAASSNNQVLVTGAGSAWNNTLEVNVGRNGSSNNLTVADGGRVDTASGYVGRNGGNNSMQVTDAGSVFNASQNLHIGHTATSNSLGIANGGRVENANGIIGYWIGADGNTATVQDSVWSNSASLTVGEYGSNNRLIVGSDGRVDSTVVNIGVQTLSSNNLVTVTGDGALLDAAELHIGGSAAGAGGTGNRVEVENGGTVATESFNMYAGNNFDLNADGRLAVNTNFDAATSGFNFNAGGTLEIGGELTGMGSAIDDQRTLVMKGSKALWNPAGRITVGYQGNNNNLFIEEGGQMVARDLVLADGSASTGNLVVVTGEGSKLTTTGGDGVIVGFSGSSNRVEVTAGGSIDASGGIGHAVLGYDVGANGNSMLVDDASAQLKQNIQVGLHGSDNQLTIANGGVVRGQGANIGRGVAADGNRAVVTGADSLLDMDTIIGVGVEGSDNSLMILDGAQAQADIGSVGYASGADNNSVLVSGEGSVWQSKEALYLGGHKVGDSWIDGGTGNSLAVEDRGRVFVGNVNTNNDLNFLPSGGLFVGNALGSAEVVVANQSDVNTPNVFIGLEADESGSVHVVDSNVQCDDGYIVVGYEGSSNELVISEGSSVRSRVGYIGTGENAGGNRVVVTGADSLWDTGRLEIGYQGSENILIITNGGMVASEHAYIEGWGGGSGNTAIITGPDSVWTNRFELIVGFAGTDNSLHILDGAKVYSAIAGVTSSGIFDEVAPGSNNTLRVSGSGSTLDVLKRKEIFDGWLDVGSGTLLIEDGGAVFANATDVNGYAIVDGSGSVLSNASRANIWAHGVLTVSDGGTVFTETGTARGGQVTIEGEGSKWVAKDSLVLDASTTIRDGGAVVSSNSYIGSAAWASGYQASVSGGSWNNTGSLVIGVDGSSNGLSITNGGRVESANGVVGHGETANGNSVIVSGLGSIWDATVYTMRPSDPLANEYISPIVNYAPIYTEPVSDITDISFNVGYFGSSNNLMITDGGRVDSMNTFIGYGEFALGNVATVSGAGSTWNSSGQMNVGYHGSDNTLRIEDGGKVYAMDSSVGFSEGAGGNRVLVSGEGSEWNTTPLSRSLAPPIVGWPPNVVYSGLPMEPTNPVILGRMGTLSVGKGGSYNQLQIEDGALVSNDYGVIGETSNAWDNSASVAGNNSGWHNTYDLSLGGRMADYVLDWNTLEARVESGWFDGGRGNSLYIGDGGLVTVGRDMHNRNYSTVNLDPGSRIEIGGDYYQDADSVLRFGVETNAVGAPLNALVSVEGTAEFETGATLQYHSNVGVLDFDVFYTNLIVEANQLIVGGVTNATALDLEAINVDGSLVDLLLWESNQNIYGLVGRKYLADSAGFAPGSQMAILSKEIDDLSLLGDSGAGAMINLLNGMSSAQQNQQITQLYEQGAPSYAHVQGITEGMGEIKKHTTRHQPAAAPEGAAGPHRPDQGWQGWVKPYGVWADYSAQNGFSGYDHNIYGTLVGADRREGDALVGVAGGYVRSDIKQDDGDSSTATTGYGVLYASWGTEDWFGDLNMAYGRSSIDQQSGTAFGNTAAYDAKNYAFYFGGGKEMKLSDGRFLFTPAASLLWSYYHQAGYTEESDYLPREVSPYDRSSILSSVGATFAYQRESGTAIVKPEARLYWLHEFNAEVDAIDYTISDGGGQYHFFMPAPLADVLEAGLGVSCRFNDELELVFDVDGRIGEDYSAYAVSGRVVFEF